ncbi:MAG: molybdate ABC transporter substrate-binding protein [Caldimicrobium thiodismutans]
MKKLLQILVAFYLTFSFSFAGEITVYAIGTMSYIINDIIKAYKSKYPQDNIKVVTGSAGKGYNQIVNGAPYDIFISADMEYPNKLKQEGYAISQVIPYGIAKPVIWTKKDSGIDLSKGINVVLDENVKKIAIPNWDLALYGKAAKECLEYYKLWDKVKSKLVIGENINQAIQFAQTGAADIAFVSLPLIMHENIKNTGNYYILPDECHSPVIHGYVMLKHANTDKETYETAKRFFDFMKSKDVKNILKNYGFIIVD